MNSLFLQVRKGRKGEFAVVIEKIAEPADLGALSFAELETLAREIRSMLVETVSRTGGHLAPNLGVVELTIALHLVFHTPEDKIIWDVGHQCYVHKILTGRREQLATIRQYGGLSGFPKTRESAHDCFETGHSSTSISAALGFALARDLNRESHAVVAVIGDGALTGGMSFEAMNHAGHLGTRLIVVLNDNEMSINNNVGALSGYLSRLRTDPLYYKSKGEIEDLLLRIPNVGRRMVKTVERLKDSLKYLLVPGIFFEELGFTYLGPVNGHDLKVLKQVFERARGVGGPVLVHVYTKKGKGYSPAEQNPDIFHGVGRFDVKTGELVKQGDNPTFTKVFGDCMLRLGERRPKLVAISAAMADGTGLKDFATHFPDRFFDVGIAEQHAVTLAAGLARSGYQPVVAIYSTFLQRAYDQIVHDVALQGLPVIFAVDRAGIVGEDGETHQGIFDLSYLRHIPGLILMAPKDQNELVTMLQSAVDYRKPVAIRYPRGQGRSAAIDEEHPYLAPGRGELLRPGKDLALLAIGPQAYTALEVAEILERRGRQAAVINCRYVKPLDEDLIMEWAERTGHLLTIEENVVAGGFGSSVLELLSRLSWRGQAFCMGIPNCFVPHGDRELLYRKYGFDAGGIADLVQSRGW
ncbi:MAG: 1-deoxy-D-xylulose-5-phosphate synthase [Thermacetogeniaceae bacterium]|jgi:1-deoxy-D-xylulose-5-phosphate synthase